MQSTEGKGQRVEPWMVEAAKRIASGSMISHQAWMTDVIAEAYSQSGAGPNVCRVSPVEAQEILANPTATKEQIEWAHQQTRTLSGAGSPERLITAAKNYLAKAPATYYGWAPETEDNLRPLRKELESAIRAAASSSQGAEATWERPAACPECDGDGCEKCQPESSVAESAPEPPSRIISPCIGCGRETPCSEYPNCRRASLSPQPCGGSTGERAERWVFWVEPFGPRDEPVYMYVPETTAVHTQRNTAWKAKKYRYVSDRHALEDFMAVNWASFVDKPKEIK